MEDKQYLCCNSHVLAIQDGYCLSCAICYICNKHLDPRDYFFCLREAARDSDPEAGIFSNPSFVHPSCFSDSEKAILASETLNIPKSLFNKLNARLLIMEPLEIGGMKDTDVLAAKTQEQDAYIKAKSFIHDSARLRTSEEHQEYLYTVLRRMESFCAALSLAVSKSRRSVELNLDKKIADQNQKAREERRQHENHKTPKTEARAEKKVQTAEDKKLQKMMNLLGCSEEEARTVLGPKLRGTQQSA